MKTHTPTQASVLSGQLNLNLLSHPSLHTTSCYIKLLLSHCVDDSCLLLYPLLSPFYFFSSLPLFSLLPCAFWRKECPLFVLTFSATKDYDKNLSVVGLSFLSPSVFSVRRSKGKSLLTVFLLSRKKRWLRACVRACLFTKRLLSRGVSERNDLQGSISSKASFRFEKKSSKSDRNRRQHRMCRRSNKLLQRVRIAFGRDLQRCGGSALLDNISLKNTYCMDIMDVVAARDFTWTFVVHSSCPSVRWKRSFSEVTGRPMRAIWMSALTSTKIERKKRERKKERNRERGGPSHKYTSFFCSLYWRETSQSL
jgi:hypothetical protein